MLDPPFCPHVDCAFHAAPKRGFCVRHGSYQPKCRPAPVPRFACKGCGRTFSRQTFRFDYRLRKPHLASSLFAHLVSGGSLRQATRFLHTSRKTVARFLVRLGSHASRYHENALSALALTAERARFQFDELESYEEDRILKPLSVATLLQEDTRLLLGLAVGTLRSRTSASAASKERRAAFEKVHGRRKNESAKILLKLLAPLQRHAHAKQDGKDPPLRLLFTTDEKRIYPFVLRALFQKDAFAHVTVSSRLPRDARNPLAPINQLDVMTRHHNARLQRESIAASKKASGLSHQLAVFLVWWNYQRRRTNRDATSPACHAGILTRRARSSELFGWRQDFGEGRLPLLDAA